MRRTDGDFSEAEGGEEGDPGRGKNVKKIQFDAAAYSLVTLKPDAVFPQCAGK